MSIVKTPLNDEQRIRLINLCEIDDEIDSANFVEINGATITKVEVKYTNDNEESIYLPREDYDFVKNGIELARDEI